MCKRFQFCLLLIIALVVFVVSCGDDDDDCETSEDDDINDDDDDDATEAISWGSCPDYLGTFFECAFADLPLNYTDPGGETLPIFLYRHLSDSADKKGSIWFLEGGPGGTGVTFAANIQQTFVPYFPQFDYYSLDHRGVGNSQRLECNDSYLADGSFDAQGCVDHLDLIWGEKIKLFTTSNAARDLAALIEKATEPEDNVFVYGVSYGTYWAQRFLQLFPEGADGVVLDSLCMPGECDVANYDELFNKTGRQFMDICAEDETCLEKMEAISDSPWEAVGEIFNRVDAGELCQPFAEMFTRDDLRNALGQMLLDWFKRIVIPPVLYRLDRCNQDDVAVLENFALYLDLAKSKALENPQFQDIDHLYSDVLGSEIVLSELLRDTSLSEIEEVMDQAYFSTDTGYTFAWIRENSDWPVYENDGTFGKWAKTEVPMLMMNGTLDPQTPLEIALPAADVFNGPNQQFVTVPYAPHCVMCASFTNEFFENDGGPTCGMEMMFNFFQNPQSPVDDTCLNDLVAVTFAADSSINVRASQFYFGTEDMWEGGPSETNDRLQNPLAPIIEKSLRQSKRRTLSIP